MYQISLTIPHTANNLNLQLIASEIQDLCDESWAIDNVSLFIYDSIPQCPSIISVNIEEPAPAKHRKFKFMRQLSSILMECNL